MAKFGYNENTIRIRRDVYLTPGSMKGKYNKKNSRIEVSGEIVPK